MVVVTYPQYGTVAFNFTGSVICNNGDTGDLHEFATLSWNDWTSVLIPVFDQHPVSDFIRSGHNVQRKRLQISYFELATLKECAAVADSRG